MAGQRPAFVLPAAHGEAQTHAGEPGFGEADVVGRRSRQQRRRPTSQSGSLQDYTQWVELVVVMLRDGFTRARGRQDCRRQLYAPPSCLGRLTAARDPFQWGCGNAVDPSPSPGVVTLTEATCSRSQPPL
jgi:hypothetical protein